MVKQRDFSIFNNLEYNTSTLYIVAKCMILGLLC
jgi:hypothetical protein